MNVISEIVLHTVAKETKSLEAILRPMKTLSRSNILVLLPKKVALPFVRHFLFQPLILGCVTCKHVVKPYD